LRKFPLAALFCLFVLSCKHKSTLPEQLKITFSNHLRQLDSLATLDSVRIIWNTLVTERLGRIVDDSVYVREYSRLKTQLSNALQKNDRDTINFYRYEINVMEKEIDSITRSIPSGDTTKSYGHLLNCAYIINKSGKTLIDSTLIFVDSTSTLRFTEYLDSSLRRTIANYKTKNQ